MDSQKTKPPKKQAEKKVRKISLPSSKVQSRVCINELRQNFQRQISLPKEKDIIPIFDPMAKAQESSSVVRGKTGVIFDEKVNEHFCIWDEKHPENPIRLSCILERCNELDLFSSCEVLRPVAATPTQIKTLHSDLMYDTLKQAKNETDVAAFRNLSMQYDSIYVNQNTFDAALLSAGCAIELTKEVLEGRVHNGMAFIRPPGHHASKDDFCGYSFFNNIALTAHYALGKVERILIVDWDVHQGNGTQAFFYDDPRVLFFSSHRYEKGCFWPNLREGDYDYCGSGNGLGYNFNIPLNETQMGNTEFLSYFHQVLLPVAYEFAPDLVLVSGGFDAAIGDLKGTMNLTPAFFAHLTSMLMPLAGGKLVVLLEGGYCPESLAEGAMHTLRTLMGYPCPRLVDPIGAPCPSMRETLLNVIHAHRPFWKCLRFQATHPPDGGSPTSDPLDLDPLPIHNPKVEFLGPEPPKPGTKFEIDDSFPEHTKEEQDRLNQELDRLKKATSLNTSPRKVSLVYDSDMEKHFNVVDKSFPERPSRTNEIMKRLSEFRILDRVLLLQSRRALRSELCLVHDDKLVDLMEELGAMSSRDRIRLADDYNSIYFNEHTWDASRLAAGSLLEVVDAVCTGRSQSGIGVIRPPGHHAERGCPMGFCFFNNVCVAAEYAQQKYSLKRILIVDWDVHHGNGVQHCFEDNPSVLYISVHVFKQGNFFPFSVEGAGTFVGKGRGRGFNVNIPWEKTGMGDGDYMSAFTQVLLPIAYQFDPDLVLVSAGFDAAVNDPLGGCCVTPECYGHLTHMLSSLANGNIILALEGGYNLISISHSMAMCAKALLGDPLPPLKQGLKPSPSGVSTLKEVIRIQKEFWSCFQFQVSLPDNLEDPLKVTLPAGEPGSPEVFLTPPQSPPDHTERAVKVSTPCDEASPVVKTEEEADKLVLDFASLTIKPEPTVTMEMGEDTALEGAVGMDPLTQATIAQLMLDDAEVHAVVPLTWCPHLEEVSLPVPDGAIEVNSARCQECLDEKENWQCLTCYKVLCGRYVRKHMVQHGEKEKHNIVLSYSDLSVWCYTCESYVHNEVIIPLKELAHRSKFGEEMPL